MSGVRSVGALMQFGELQGIGLRNCDSEDGPASTVTDSIGRDGDLKREGAGEETLEVGADGLECRWSTYDVDMSRSQSSVSNDNGLM